MEGRGARSLQIAGHRPSPDLYEYLTKSFESCIIIFMKQVGRLFFLLAALSAPALMALGATNPSPPPLAPVALLYATVPPTPVARVLPNPIVR